MAYLRGAGICCTGGPQRCCWRAPWQHPAPWTQRPLPSGNLVHGPAAAGLFAREMSGEVTDSILPLASVIWIQNECVYKDRREREHLLDGPQEHWLMALRTASQQLPVIVTISDELSLVINNHMKDNTLFGDFTETQYAFIMRACLWNSLKNKQTKKADFLSCKTMLLFWN